MGTPEREAPRSIVDQFHQHWRDTVAGNRVTWMGVECLKNPFDLFVYQQVIHDTRPDVIVECGTAFGGSALFLANMCDLIDHGEVFTIDIQQMGPKSPPGHPRISYIRGSSLSAQTLEYLRGRLAGRKGLVILDSEHTKEHVLREMEIYREFVPTGGYMIVEDSNINGHPILPHFGPGPMEAITEFVAKHPDWYIDVAREYLLFTYNPSGYLRRL